LNFEACDKCKDSVPKGHLTKTINSTLVLVPCSCYKEWLHNERLTLKLKASGIPEHTLDQSLSDYKGTQSINTINMLKKFIDKFEEKGKRKSLYFYGDNGTQKSTTAFIIAKELIDQGYIVKYTLMDTLITMVQSQEFKEEYKDKLDEYLSSDLLIVDESFSKDKVQMYKDSSFQMSKLTTFLKNRMEIACKSIIFISNSRIEDMQKEGFTKSIANLVYRNTLKKVLEFKDEYIEVVNAFEVEDLWD